MEITFSDLGFGDIHVPGLRVVSVEANFTSEITGRAEITAIIYAVVGESSVTMEITINNDSTLLFPKNGVTQKTWSQDIKETNHLRIKIINVGSYNVTVYSNSTIRIVFETQGQENSTIFLPERADPFWLALLIGAYAAPFLITFIYKVKVEEQEEEEELPAIVG